MKQLIDPYYYLRKVLLKNNLFELAHKFNKLLYILLSFSKITSNFRGWIAMNVHK